LDGATVFAALPPSRFALWRDKSPRQGGPDLLLLERACGEPVEELRSRFRRRRDRHRGTPMQDRGDPARSLRSRCASDRDWRGACAVLKARERRGFKHETCRACPARLMRGRPGGRRGTVNRGRDSDTAGGVGVTAALSSRSRHDNAGTSELSRQRFSSFLVQAF